MTYSFNLIDEKWIPCILLNGRVEEFSLRSVFSQAHEMYGVQGDSPLETAALYRLLLAVLHSALRGPRNQEEWVALWEQNRWKLDQIDTYLNKWHDHFDLFHPERPFYQVREDRMAIKPIVQLTHGMGTANEMFEHNTIIDDIVLNPKQATRSLLVGQAFGLGGLGHPQLKITLTNAPLTRGIVFLIEGANLFQTVLLNLVRYAKDRPLPTSGEDQPAWEMDDPFTPNRKQPRGYLDYLTWQNRKITLIPEDKEGQTIIRQFWIARGMDLGEVFDPMKQYRKTEKGWRQWVFTEDRNLWRDSHTLFRLKSPDENKPPKAFQELADYVGICLDATQTYHCIAFGTGMHYKDAKIFFYRQEHLPLPLAYIQNVRSEELVGQLASALDLTVKVRGKLWGAVNTLAKYILAPDNETQNGRDAAPKDVENLTNHWSVERDYWGALELPFLQLLEGLPTDLETTMKEWKDTLKKTAWLALEKAADQAGDNVRALKAAVRARNILGHGLKELFPEPEKEVSA